MLEPGKIYKGDSFDLLDQIDDGSIDLLLTDPPYNISKKNSKSAYAHGKVGLNFGDWDFGFDTEGWMHKVADKLNPDTGQVVIFNSFKNMEIMARVLEEHGFTVHENPVYWFKPNPVPHLPNRIPVNSMEQVLWATRGDNYTFNVRDGKDCEVGRYVHSPHEDGKKRFHTTQKPLSMFKEIVRVHSKKGDLILDTFSGSGVTITACEALKRDCIAFERDDFYFEKSTERHQKAKKKPKSLWV